MEVNVTGLINRKSYCRDCKDHRREKTLDSKIEYSFDISDLSNTKEITIRGRDLNNHRYESVVGYAKAVKLVEEGAAGIYHSTLIHHFYNRKSLREYILERDSHTCHYCSRYGDKLIISCLNQKEV